VAELAAFSREHLDGALALFGAEGWETYTEDAERTYRALSAPGSTTLVALSDGEVVGAIQLQSDGEIQAHLSLLIVGEAARGQGIARRLLREALRRAGGMRMDILTRTVGFYERLGADSVPGFRLRPDDMEGW
jgi:ribosomal protein S18 acetylase RimI-like enzyme